MGLVLVDVNVLERVKGRTVVKASDERYERGRLLGEAIGASSLRCDQGNGGKAWTNETREGCASNRCVSLHRCGSILYQMGRGCFSG